MAIIKSTILLRAGAAAVSPLNQAAPTPNTNAIRPAQFLAPTTEMMTEH
jgi:hypothetical protein